MKLLFTFFGLIYDDVHLIANLHLIKKHTKETSSLMRLIKCYIIVLIEKYVLQPLKESRMRMYCALFYVGTNTFRVHRHMPHLIIQALAMFFLKCAILFSLHVLYQYTYRCTKWVRRLLHMKLLPVSQ